MNNNEENVKCPVFEGCATALITPFSDGKIDYASFERIIGRQISRGVRALVFCGTTGEAPTVTEQERDEMCRFAAKTVSGRAKVIFGCGSNSTEGAVRLARRAESLGADAFHAVTPYNNNASPEGIVSHYREICRSVSIPVIAYNVPSRTGVDLDPGLCREIAKIHNLAGIKEATGSVSRAACLISDFGASLPLYSGADEVNVPILSIGGSGIISVASNVFPEFFSRMCSAAAEGDFAAASAMSRESYPFVASLFSEVNPIPVKTLMAHLGMCREEFRLPLCPLGAEKRKRLFEEYEKFKEAHP